MLHSLRDTGPASACYFTCSDLVDAADDSQPRKRAPLLKALSASRFTHTVDILLPDEIWQIIERQVSSDAGTFRYSKVNLSPLEIISGDFFNHYIKTGNILMISEGRPHVDNRISLIEGVLRIELDKATYERCGLVGKPVPSLGRKHVKSRYAIELNLRLPSMVRGKKGFDRIVWALTRVLNQPLTWLMVDLQQPSNGGASAPNDQYHPINYTVKPSITRISNAVVPLNVSREAMVDFRCQEQLLEWIGLALLESPRIRRHDQIDPYICRYEPPEACKTADTDDLSTADLVHLRWRGLIPEHFIMALYLLVDGALSNKWAVVSGSSFDGNAFTSLSLSKRQLVWESV